MSYTAKEYDKWVRALRPLERRVWKVLLEYEYSLSDGFGYYGMLETWKAMLNKIVDKSPAEED